MICFPVLDERADEAYQSMQREMKRSMFMLKRVDEEEEEEGADDGEVWRPGRGELFMPREELSKCNADRSIE